jgi:hypothetical protein
VPGENNIPVEGKSGDAARIYRVRDSQVVNVVSLVSLLGVFGAFWTYYNSERSAQAEALGRIEARYTREIDRLEQRLNEMDSRWERRLVWIEREIKK